MRKCFITFFNLVTAAKDFLQGLPRTVTGSTLTAVNQGNKTVDDDATDFLVAGVTTNHLFVDPTTGKASMITLVAQHRLTLNTFAPAQHAQGDDYWIQMPPIPSTDLYSVDIASGEGPVAVVYYRDVDGIEVV